MRPPTSFIVAIVLSLAGVGSAAPLDDLEHAGRSASNALRDFQTLELKAVQAKAPWPTAEQHRQITRRLTDASDGIARSLELGLNPPHPQVVSMMKAAGRAVTSLTPWVTPRDDQPQAPEAAVKALAKLQTAYTKLLTFFPAVPVSEEQLTR